MNDKKHISTRPRQTGAAHIYGKVPPQATDLESAVLGAIILEKDKRAQVLEIIPHGEVFYNEANQIIYHAIKEMFVDGYMVDMLTVTDKLRKSGKLEAIGGAHYLVGLTTGVVSSAHVETHARIVLEKYLSRELIRISSETIGVAYDDEEDVFDLISSSLNRVDSLVDLIEVKQAKSIGESSKKVTKEITELRQSGTPFKGLSTGYKSVDEVLKGLKPDRLIILAARPSVGKTAFALNIALNISLQYIPVGVFSMEMSVDDITMRNQSTVTGIPHEKLLEPIKMSESEYQTYCKADQILQNTPLFVDDTPELDISLLSAKAKNMLYKYDIKLFIVDYLQLMEGGRKSNGNRENEISKISRGLKKLAGELGVPIIAISQLNRKLEERADRTPRVSDLRESGAIEQDADTIILLHEPTKEEIKDVLENEGIDLTGILSILFPKNRGGKTGTVNLKFDKSRQQFSEAEDLSVVEVPQQGELIPLKEANKKAQEEEPPF